MVETTIWPLRPAPAGFHPGSVDPGWLGLLPEGVRPSGDDDDLWWRLWSPTVAGLLGHDASAGAVGAPWDALLALDRGACVRLAEAVGGALTAPAGSAGASGAPRLGPTLSEALREPLRELPPSEAARLLVLGAARRLAPDAVGRLKLRFPPAGGGPGAESPEALSQADARRVALVLGAAIAGYPLPPAAPQAVS